MCIKAMDDALKRVQGAYADEVINDSPNPGKLAQLKEAVQVLGTEKGMRPAQLLSFCLQQTGRPVT